MRAVCLWLAVLLTLLSGTAQAHPVSPAANSLIIPMDTTYQNYGMFKAYGLVNKLLQNGIPVIWAIADPKSWNGSDFTATTIDDRTSAVIGSYTYTGGPFIIDSADAAAAQTVINAWWAANGNQPTVHKATAGFSANSDITLKSPPRIALESTNSGIAMTYFNAAGIPDLNGNVWSSASPNVLSQTMIACNSGTSCTGDSVVGNGALFTSGACSPRRFDTFVTPHNGGYSYSLTDPADLGTQTYAELDYFTGQGGGWTALCHSILSNENNVNDLTRNGSASVKALFGTTTPGGMLTQFGFPAINNVGGTWTVALPGLPLAQAVPTPGATQALPGGSVQTWHEPNGTSTYAQYWPATERAAYFNAGGVKYDWGLTGTHHNGSGAGKITFLGGHSYSTALPYSTNYEAPYLRFFYNSLFFNGAAVAKLGLVTTPTTAPQGTTTPVQITLKNTGSSTATTVQPATITLASGFTYVSTTGTQPTAVAAGAGGTTILTYPALSTVAASATPIIINATVTSATTGSYKAANLSVQYGDVYGESFTSNDCTSITIAPTPGVAITKTPAIQGPATVGSTVAWTLSYSNPGSVGLQNPYVEDILPSAFTYATASPAPTYIIPVTGGTKLRWTLASPLAAGGSGTITLRATVQTATGQPFTNTGSLKGNDTGGTSYSTTATATVSVDPPEAALGKAVSPTGTVASGSTLTYTLSPSSPGPTLLSGIRFYDAPPINTTYVNASVSPTNLGTFGAYVPVAGIPGSDPGPDPVTTMTLSVGTTPFTYAIGSTVTVSMALNNAAGSTGAITGVTADLTPSDGVSTCVPLSTQPVASIAANSTSTVTFTCTIESQGEITWDGNATGTISGGANNGLAYDFISGTSPSILGVPTTTGTSVVQWKPTLNTSNTAGVPSSNFSAGTGQGLFAFDGTTAIWERYDIPNNAWVTSPVGLTNSLPATAGDGAALVYDGGGYTAGYVYAFRGGATTTFWRYKLSDGTAGVWTPVSTAAPFSVGTGGALTRLGNYLYALQGGTTTGFARYDLTANTWTTLANVTQAVAAGGALATDGTYVYAFVGNNKKVFYRYNPTTNTWATMAAPPWAIKQGGSLTAIGTTIYALRGNNNNGAAKYVANATTGTWTKIANAPAATNAGGALTTDGTYLYAFRGNNTKTFYRYSPTANTWTAMTATTGNVTTGGALTWVPANTSASYITNTLAAPVLVTGSTGSRATIQITQTLGSSAAVSGITPTALAVTSSNAFPATAASAANCTVSPTGAQSITAGGTLVFTWTCTNVYASGNNANNSLGSLTFSAGAAGTTPATTWTTATANSVLVTQPLTYQATINASPTTFTQVTNTGLLSDSSAFSTGVGSNTNVNPITRSPNLLVTKSVSPATGTQVTPGTTLTYSLEVQNTTAGQATTVSVTDVVPTGTTYSGCSASVGTCSQTGGTVTYNVGTLAGYGTATLAMTVTAATPAAAGSSTVSNTANFTYNGTGGPFSGSSNSVSNPLLATPAVTISKAQSVSPAADANGWITPGSDITYTMTVTNPSGAVPATSVVATDAVPTGTSYTSCTTSVGTCSQAGGIVTYTIGSMAANSTATLTMVVKVSNPAVGASITNAASVSAATNVSGSTYAAYSNQVSYQINAAPIISVVKSSSPASGSTVVTGDTITYTLVVKNTGNANTTSAFVTDSLPANTAYVSGSTKLNGTVVPDVTTGVSPLFGKMSVFTSGYGDPTGDGGTLVSENAPGGTANDATIEFKVTVTTPSGVASSIPNTATAGSGSTTPVTSATVTVTTLAAPAPPLANNDSVTTNYNTPVVLPILANDAGGKLSSGAATTLAAAKATVDLDPTTSGQQDTFTVTNKGTFTVQADGTVKFIPVSGFSGTVSIPYTVTDDASQISNEALITVTTHAPNPSSAPDPPVANDDYAVTTVNTPVTLKTLLNDTGGWDSSHTTATTLDPATITFIGTDLNPGASGFQTAEGTWSINAATGDVTFTPASGFTGTATLPYTVKDNLTSTAQTSNQATLAVVVTGGSAPVASPDSAVTKITTAVTLAILDNDKPSSGYQLIPGTVDLDPSTAGILTSITTVEGDWSVTGGIVTFLPTDNYLGSHQPFTGVTAPLPYAVTDTNGNIATSTITVTVQPEADLSITKSVNITTPYVGDEVTFTITVTNNGPSAATGVAVTDLLPSGYTFISSSSGNYNSGTGVWTIGSLANGGSATLNITALVLTTGSYTNSATVTATTYDPTPSNNSASGSTTPKQFVDLAVTKSDGQTTVQPGQQLTYTITVKNLGSITANTVTVDDTFPSTYLTFVSDTSGLTRTESPAGTYHWTRPSLAPGATWSFNVVATVKTSLPDGTTSISNRASASFVDTADPTVTTDRDLTNNAATDVDTVATHPDLTIAKTFASSDNPARVNSTVTYRLAGANSGHATATNVTITDTPDSRVTYTNSALISYNGGATASITAASTSPLTFNLSNLAPGDTYVLTYTVTVNSISGSPNYLANTATISSPPQSDLDTSNNTASVGVPIFTGPDLGVFKSAVVSSETQKPGDTITYTLAYRNDGSAASDAATKIVDTVPTNTTLVSGSITKDRGTVSESGGVITWNLGSLASLASGSVSFQVTINPLPAGETKITNTATISPTDDMPSDNTSTVDTTITAQPDLSITKVADKSVVLPGDPLTYTITYRNVGNQAATGVTITDTLLNNVTYQSANPTPTSISGNTITWNIGPLSDFDPHTITVDATVNASALPLSIAGNRVTIADDGNNGIDPNPENNTATSSVPVVAPYVVLEKQATGPVYVGNQLTYTLNWSNVGTAVAKSVVIEDPLPAYTSFVSATGGGTYSSGTGKVTWDLGDQAVGANGFFTVTVTVNAGAGGDLQTSPTLTTKSGSGSVTVGSKTSAYNSLSWCDTGLTGTVTLTSGSATLTGDGTTTKFLTELSAGKKIKINGVVYTIASVESDVSLTLTSTYTGTTTPGLTMAFVSCLYFDGVYQGADATPPLGYNDNPRLTAFNDASWTVPVAATIEPPYLDPATLGADWVTMNPASQASPNYSFYRQAFCLPLNATGMSATVQMAVDDVADLYLNGAELGQGSGSSSPISFNGAGFIQSGINLLAVGLLNNNHGGHPPENVDHTSLIFNLGAAYTGLRPFVYGPTTVMQGQTVTFTADDAALGGRRPYIYKIDYGDGTTAGYQSGVSFTHTYSTPGTYTATITARAAYGCTGTDSVTITVLPTGKNLLANPATVSYADANGKSDTDTSGAGVELLPVADLRITKTNGKTTVSPGEGLSYTITVTNAGPSVANGAVFTDPAVANLTVADVTCASYTGAAACPTLPDTALARKALLQGTGGITISTLPAASSVTFIVTGTAGATGTIANTATITPPMGVTDPNSADNSATDSDTITPVATDNTYTVTYHTTKTGNILTDGVGDSGSGLVVAQINGKTETCTQFACTVGTQHGSVTVNTDGSFSYTSDSGYYGTDWFTYYDRDVSGTISNTATVSFTIIAPNTPPQANNDNAVIKYNTPVTLTVLDTDAGGRYNGSSTTLASATATVDLNPSADGQQATFTVANEGTFTVQADGSVKFEPVSGFYGTVSIPYTVTDSAGQLSNTALITVTVYPPATAVPPTAVDDSAFTPLNTQVTIPVLTNDRSGFTSAGTASDLNPATVTFIGVDSDLNTPGFQTTEGTWTIDTGTGAVTFTPVTGFTGVATLPYTVQDQDTPALTSNVALITVIVGGAPVARPDEAVTRMNVPVSLPILDNDTSSSGFQFNPASVTFTGIDLDPSTPGFQTTEGTWTVDAAGIVTFTPNSGFTGTTAAVPYSVTDTNGKTAIGAITVTVTPTSLTANNDSATTPVNTPVTINVAANDASKEGAFLNPTTVLLDTNPLTPEFEPGTSYTDPGKGTWTVLSDGSVKFTPVDGYTGTPSPITYRISDSLGNTATATITVTVTSISDMITSISCVPDPATSGQPTSCTLTCSNSGPGATSAALGVSCDFVTIPSGATPHNCPATASSLTVGGSVSDCYVTFTPVASGTVTLTGTASATNETDTANNGSSKILTVDPAADLSVAKTVVRSGGTGTCGVGCQLTFTITVTNNGPSTATSFTLADTWPSTLTYGSSNPTATYDSGTGTYRWSYSGSLASGQSTAMTITGAINNTYAGGSISNTATISNQVPTDPVSGNDTATLSFNPTRVSLSDFRVVPGEQGGTVEWATTTETGTLGFHLYRWDSKVKDFLPLTSTLLPGLLDSPTGGVYTFRDDQALPWIAQKYLLVEQEASGQRHTYGPFAFGSGPAGSPAPALNSFDYRPGIYAHQPELPTGDGSIPDLTGIYDRTPHPDSPQREQRLAAAVTAEPVPAASAPAGLKTLALAAAVASSGIPAVKASVTADGLYYLDSAVVGPLLGLSADQTAARIAARTLALKSGGAVVAWLPSVDNRGLWFWGRQILSQYAKENIYWLTLEPGVVMLQSAGRVPAAAVSPDQIYTGSVHAEENLKAALGTPTPEQSLWYWNYVIAGTGLNTQTFPISVDHLASGPAAGLTLHLMSTSRASTWVSVALNGTPLGEAAWTGNGTHDVTLPVAPGLLTPGANSVSLTALKEQGALNSVVYLDSLDLRYPRTYRTGTDLLSCRGDGNSTVTVAGFTSGELVSLDLTNPDKPKTRGTRLTPDLGGTWQATFAPVTATTPYVVTSLDRNRQPQLTATVVPTRLQDRTLRADWVAITPAALEPAVQRLAARRQAQGLETQVVLLEEVMDTFSSGLYRPRAIQDFLIYAAKKWAKAPRFALLVGDGSYDYQNILGNGGNLLPPAMTATPFGAAAADNLYGDINGNNIPEIAVGRLPVVSISELDAVISKITAYEDTPRTAGDDRLLLLADSSDPNAGNFAAANDVIATIAPKAIAVKKIYRDQMSAASARSQFLADLQSGIGFLAYAGHASMFRIGTDSLLTTADVPNLTNLGRLPIVMADTCYVNAYQNPGNDTLGEALVVAPGGGAVAVVSSSILSMEFQAQTLALEFHRALWNPKTPTIGGALLTAVQKFAQSGGAPYLVNTYTLLGDPATRTRMP